MLKLLSDAFNFDYEEKSSGDLVNPPGTRVCNVVKGASCELFDELVMDVERLFRIVVEQMRCRLEVGSGLSVGLCRC